MKITLYTSAGKENGSLDLPVEMFGVEASKGLLHEAVLRQQGNARIDTASAKTRSEVRGGGRKPWKQKGTGRARQGSIRSAQWRGGGVIFGPQGNRNYAKNMPRKMRRKALFGSLSSRLENTVALESFSETIPKTKAAVQLLAKMGCTRRILLIIPDRNDVLEKSFRNIPGVKVLFAQYLNIVDIMSAHKIIFLQEAITKAHKIFFPQK